MGSDDSLSDVVNGIKIKAFPVQAAYSLVLVVCMAACTPNVYLGGREEMKS